MKNPSEPIPVAGTGTLLTFDCYGTLIDWESGILAALRNAYPDATGIGDEALLAEFHAAQNRLKTSTYRTYRTLLTETAEEVALTRGWPSDRERAASIPASIPEWQPFPDTNAALERLAQAHTVLGILSNIDNDLISSSLTHFTVEFPLVGTAQNLRSYKPASVHFEAGRRWAKDFDRWVHVAQSLYHDIEPTTELGIPALWVNRKDEPVPKTIQPIHVATDLATAVTWLLSGHEPSRHHSA